MNDVHITIKSPFILKLFFKESSIQMLYEEQPNKKII